MYWDLPINEGGFDFKNYQRNQYLSQQGYKHRYMKTGTTIVGCIYNNGVVLGADTRATEDTIAADLDCEKCYYYDFEKRKNTDIKNKYISELESIEILINTYKAMVKKHITSKEQYSVIAKQLNSKINTTANLLAYVKREDENYE